MLQQLRVALEGHADQAEFKRILKGTLEQDRTTKTTIEDIFEPSRLPGMSPVRAMIKAGDFTMFSRRERKSPQRKPPGNFAGCDLHDSHWRPTSSIRKLSPLKREFLNDYVYNDYDTKKRRKPKLSFFLGNKTAKAKRISMNFDNYERNETASSDIKDEAANLASDS